jgi:hypothetical protein
MDCFAALAMTAATNRDTLNRHRPRRRAIQYSETPMIESKGRGVLDTPLSRSMTASARSGGDEATQGQFTELNANVMVH